MTGRDRLAHWIAAAVTPVVALYIRRQRQLRWHASLPIDPAMRRRLSPYFPARDLDAVRLYLTDDSVVPEPPLAGLLHAFGLDFPSMSLVSGITLQNLLSLRPPVQETLLFHELVHVVQFRLLGLRRFCYHYARGLLATGVYESIPLERCAFELEERFRRSTAPFAVEDEVRLWLEEKRF